MNKLISYISFNLPFGFESNFKVNSDRKLTIYMSLVLSLSSSYNAVNFVNISMSDLGALYASCDSLHILYFSCLNKDWANLDSIDV